MALTDLIATLYKRPRSNSVYTILSAYENSVDILDELQQDVFVAAHENEESFEEESEAMTWLCGIAKNVGRNHVRAQTALKRNRVVPESELEAAADEDGNPVPYYERTGDSDELAALSAACDAAPTAEEEDWIATVLSELPPQTAEVYRMAAQGYRFPEIADALGLTASSVWHRVNRAKDYFTERGRNCHANVTKTICERDRVSVAKTSSLFEWAARATAIPLGASMEQVREQQMRRFHALDSAIRMRAERMAS